MRRLGTVNDYCYTYTKLIDHKYHHLSQLNSKLNEKREWVDEKAELMSGTAQYQGTQINVLVINKQCLRLSPPPLAFNAVLLHFISLWFIDSHNNATGDSLLYVRVRMRIYCICTESFKFWWWVGRRKEWKLRNKSKKK